VWGNTLVWGNSLIWGEALVWGSAMLALLNSSAARQATAAVPRDARRTFIVGVDNPIKVAA